MVFSHLPAGYITSVLFHNSWKKLGDGTYNFLLGTLLFFSMVPDLDFIYLYLVNGENSHHQFITHAPLLYISLAVFFILLSLVSKSQVTSFVGAAILVGGLGHLALDSIFSGIAWLWPANRTLLGLNSYQSFWLIMRKNPTFYYIATELIICFIAALIFIKRNIPGFILKMILWTVVLTAAVSASVFLHLAENHLRQREFNFALDSDSDGIIDYNDLDLDGDGINNLVDPDVNGNNIKNQEEFLIYVNDLNGIWYNYLHDRFFDAAYYFGVISNVDVLKIPLSRVGIDLKNEMADNYKANPTSYGSAKENSPRAPSFANNSRNIYQFFVNKNLVLKKDATLEVGDIFFFGQPVSHLAILVDIRPDGKNIGYFLMEADSDHLETNVVRLEDIQKKYGEAIGIVRTWPKKD